MRGQAFVSFPDAKTADKALKEVNEFPLYGKAMVRACSCAFLHMKGARTS